MDQHCEAMLEQFCADKETFDIIREIATRELRRIVDEAGMLVTVIEARVKTEDSLAGKLELKGEKYRTLSDITDLVGARVVTFYTDEVDIVAKGVESTFEMDWENSVDKRAIYAPDQFGYMSLHYICRIPESLYSDPAHPLVNEYRFEIQMRTALQHVWATIFHDTGYKSDVEVPQEYIRGLNRMAGLLEVADTDFREIRDNLEAYRENARKLIAEHRFEEALLDKDTFTGYLETHPFDALNKRIASINSMDISPASLEGYLSVLRAIGLTTVGDVDRMIAECSEDAYRLAESQLSVTDLDIMSATLGIRYLCIIYVLYQGGGEAGLRWLHDQINGKRATNARTARRLYKRASDLGIGSTDSADDDCNSSTTEGKE